MLMKEEKILSINPGTREFGVAVIEDDTLVYYRVKNTGRRRSERGAAGLCQDVERCVARLARQFRPTQFALKRLHRVYQRGPLLKRIYVQFKRSADDHGLTVHEFSPTFVRGQLCPRGRPTKLAVAEELCHQYPELSQYLTKPGRQTQKYYLLMFEAVAVGLVCRQRLKAARNGKRDSYQSSRVSTH